ncbi:hypothetical protein ACFX10_017423 [Malus domestica]
MATPSGHLLLKLLVCTVLVLMVAVLATKAEEGTLVCDIIQTVYRNVKTAVDRQAACECIIDLAPFNRTSETRIAGLPTKCGIPNNNCTI